jgi:hypothetical protein
MKKTFFKLVSEKVSLLRTIRHPNIVLFFGAGTSQVKVADFGTAKIINSVMTRNNQVQNLSTHILNKATVVPATTPT